MPQQIRAVIVDPTAPEQLAIKQVDLRDPWRLNREHCRQGGELRTVTKRT